MAGPGYQGGALREHNHSGSAGDGGRLAPGTTTDSTSDVNAITTQDYLIEEILLAEV